MWIAGLVLMIACANIANLLMVRGMQRKAEMSVRTALGAMRTRLCGSFLQRAVLLAGIGGVTALAVSYGGARMLLMLAFPGDQHLPISARPSFEVLGFAICVAIATGVVFGVAPALIAAKAHLQMPCAAGPGRRWAVRHSCSVGWSCSGGVVSGTAGGRGAFSQSLGKLQHADMKLESHNRYIVYINAQAAGYKDDQVDALYRILEERFHAIPGVVNVGVSTFTPMEGNDDGYGVHLVGQPDIHIEATNIIVNPQYFDSVGTQVLMGRGITAHDTATSPHVAVVNEDFVKRLQAGREPDRPSFVADGDSPKPYGIVGVVAGTSYTDVRRNGKRPCTSAR